MSLHQSEKAIVAQHCDSASHLDPLKGLVTSGTFLLREELVNMDEEPVVKSREEWQNELIRRQDNIDPIRRIPNVALFHGTLINGGQRWNRVQRVGAMLVGTCALAMGVLGLGWIVSAMRLNRGADVAMAILSVFGAPFSFWAGYKIIANALLSPDQNRKRGSRR
jgi:hypothetical protein